MTSMWVSVIIKEQQGKLNYSCLPGWVYMLVGSGADLFVKVLQSQNKN